MVLLGIRGGRKEEEEEGSNNYNNSKRKKNSMRLWKYEVGRTLGEGNFGKVKYARNLESGQSFAIKILEKHRIFDLNITDQVYMFIQLLVYAVATYSLRYWSITEG